MLTLKEIRYKNKFKLTGKDKLKLTKIITKIYKYQPLNLIIKIYKDTKIIKVFTKTYTILNKIY